MKALCAVCEQGQIEKLAGGDEAGIVQEGMVVLAAYTKG